MKSIFVPASLPARGGHWRSKSVTDSEQRSVRHTLPSANEAITESPPPPVGRVRLRETFLHSLTYTLPATATFIDRTMLRKVVARGLYIDTKQTVGNG